MARGDEWLSIFAASQRTGISRARLQRLIAVGELGGLRIAGRTVIRVDELEQLLARDHANQLAAISA